MTRSLLARRVVLLIVCACFGLMFGLIASWLSGSEAWFLAVPVCIALGWILVADPTACAPPWSWSRDGSPSKRDPI